MVIRMLFLALTMMLLNGCAPYRDVYREELDTLPHRYSQFDVKMAWDAGIVGTDIHIEGVVENVRYFEMAGIEIGCTLRDAAGNTLARSTSFIIPNVLKRYQTAPFSLTMPTQRIPGTKLVFTYRYAAHEDEDQGVRWMQSFEAEVP